MATPTHTRRAALRERLIVISEARIVREGPGTLRARDLANDAGCAVGAIYNVAKDMGDLVQAVNERTFAKLTQALAECADEVPLEELTSLAKTYHRFTQNNENLWATLFESPNVDYARWYQAAFDQLHGYFEDPILRISPQLDAQKRSQRARALFSSVHGIVLINRNAEISGILPGQVDRMLVMAVKQIAGK